MSEAVRSLSVLRVAGGTTEIASDQVAVEAPLEVRLHGEPFSVIMRTPGADTHLGAGFLFSEGVVRTRADIRTIEAGDSGDVLDVTLSAERESLLPDFVGTRRQVAMNSSCGMCGRRSLESLAVDAPPLPMAWTIRAGTVGAMPVRLLDAQTAFAVTGGLHAAGLFDEDGQLVATAEDVGRHNAVDKLVGQALLTGRLPLDRHALSVSGRSSFEIVQKAVLAGIPILVAVSAPSSLAVDLADRCGMTLVGFARDGRFNVYSHPSRIVTSG
jgi:FdhD protein